MTAPTDEFIKHITGLLKPTADIQAGRFFGGVGISNGTVQFAMLMAESLYFVVDERSRKKYEQAGVRPFSYATKKGRVLVRRYYEVPGEVLADPVQLAAWAREAIAIAETTAKPKKSTSSTA